jgi:hypothetical protein
MSDSQELDAERENLYHRLLYRQANTGKHEKALDDHGSMDCPRVLVCQPRSCET